MAKRVYFAFHYQDVLDFRANVVRNHWMTKPDREAAGFFDASIWEKAKKTSPLAVKRLINEGLENTSVTCVLIGSQTYLRPWVRYEILKSLKKGNKLIGVHINSVKGKDEKIKTLGPNPFEYLARSYSATGETATLHEWLNGAWTEYAEIDRGASYRPESPAGEKLRGLFIQLTWVKVYDWVANDGFSNFSDWVG